jgi:pilus assembly protein Flp/PilA
MKKLFNTFLQDEQGQDLVEYALLLAFIALAAIASLGNVKTAVTSMFQKVSTQLNTAG